MSVQRNDPADPVLRSLSDDRTRTIFYRLYAHPTPLTAVDLATWLTAEERDTPLVDLTRDDIDNIRTALVHNYLPRLEDAALIEWDRDTGHVRATNHPVLSNPKLRKILKVDAENWDMVVSALSHQRQREILMILRDTPHTLSRTEIADRLAAHDPGTEADRLDAAGNLDVLLHHNHLPALDEAGLIDYDSETGHASYTGHPELDDSWIDVWAAEHSSQPLSPPPSAGASASE